MYILIDYQWVWFGIGFICIAVAFFVLVKQEEERGKQLCAEAAKLGFKVGDSKIKALKKAPSFCLSAKQVNPTVFVSITNLSQGVFNGTKIAIYEYTYSSRQTEGASSTETVVAFPVPSETIPEFSLYLLGHIPLAGLLQNINRIRNTLFTYNGSREEEIRFSPEHSYLKNYVLLGKNKTEIQSIFNADVLQLFSEPSSQDWKIICAKGWMNLSHQRKELPPNELFKFISEAKQIFDKIILNS